MTGIGVDDMFVMLAAWRQTDFRLPVEERMGKAFSEAALSITITSLTDALSIGIGTITKFRSVRIFCTYTVIAVLFDYIYQITFFASCMVLTGRREASNRHSATCMKAVPKSLAGIYIAGRPCFSHQEVDTVEPQAGILVNSKKAVTESQARRHQQRGAKPKSLANRHTTKRSAQSHKQIITYKERRASLFVNYIAGGHAQTKGTHA